MADTSITDPAIQTDKTKEPDWITALAPTQNQVRARTVLPGGCGTKSETTGAVPQHESATSDGNRISYRELAPHLTEHTQKLGFTHVELLPVMEHPFYGSWGYQTTGYLAPTSRYGPPEDFMFLVDYLHQHDIGVILDWVPSHFPNDEHGPVYFDGSHLFEHADPRQGIWLDRYHVDGLPVDAVASMLYLDYSRKDGQWIPNEYGGRENLKVIHFLRQLNEEVYKAYPGT
jgi:1,4-alpha-glucan branching enzyme